MRIMVETWRSEKGLISVFAIGMILYIIMIVAIYPGESFVNYLKSIDIPLYDAIMQLDIEKASEKAYRFYLSMYMLAFGYLILVILAGLSGSAIFSKDYDTNTLDLFMSLPISRRKIFVECLTYQHTW